MVDMPLNQTELLLRRRHLFRTFAPGVVMGNKQVLFVVVDVGELLLVLS